MRSIKKAEAEVKKKVEKYLRGKPDKTSLTEIYFALKKIAPEVEKTQNEIVKKYFTVKKIALEMKDGVVFLETLTDDASVNEEEDVLSAARIEKLPGYTETLEQKQLHLVKNFPYINIKFNQEKIDKKHPIVLIVHPNLLFDNPSLALAIQNLKEQLGENVMIVLPYDKQEKINEFCKTLNEEIHTNLNANDFVVVPREARAEEIVKMVKEDLEQKGLKSEGMKLKVIGPRNWAEPYQEVSGIKELIIVISEVGEENGISRGDIALLAGLVDEGLLSVEDKDRLLNEALLKRANKNVFVLQVEKIEEKAKEAEEIEDFREKMKEYN